jgi:hypothetical protein
VAATRRSMRTLLLVAVVVLISSLIGSCSAAGGNAAADISQSYSCLPQTPAAPWNTYYSVCSRPSDGHLEVKNISDTAVLTVQPDPSFMPMGLGVSKAATTYAKTDTIAANEAYPGTQAIPAGTAFTGVVTLVPGDSIAVDPGTLNGTYVHVGLDYVGTATRATAKRMVTVVYNKFANSPSTFGAAVACGRQSFDLWQDARKSSQPGVEVDDIVQTIIDDRSAITGAPKECGQALGVVARDEKLPELNGTTARRSLQELVPAAERDLTHSALLDTLRQAVPYVERVR